MQKSQDEVWFAKLLLNNAAYKFCLIITLTLNVILIFFIIALWNKGKEIYVLDKSTGRTYGTTGTITADDVDIMVMGASKSFITDFLNYDHATIEKARLRAFMRLSPSLKTQYGKDLGRPESIESAIKYKSQYTLKFIIGPSIVERAYPHYKTFMRVIRRVEHSDGRYMESELNFSISMIRRNPTIDFPDGLYVTDIQQIDKENTQEINKMLNLIQ